jgi:3'(2'), 5'-bisphosphate nucleotidase
MKEWSVELGAATAAVRAAARVCRAVQERLVTADTLQKKDKSPVTVADFASQAIVCAHLEAALPRDPIIGEEDAHELREDANALLRAAVVERVAAERGESLEAERVLDWIDRGGAAATRGRMWTLDPIDGTKGFLRGEQYAIALALLVDGEVELGVLGCPNLAHDGRPGALFVATRGGGARVGALWDERDAGRPIAAARLASPAAARFCESVESGHSDQDESASVARLLGITAAPCRMDSQCKYGAVARDDAQIYLRLPTRADYQEKIWDHAAGKLVVEAAGGTVTDVEGRPLDFSRGRTLAANKGVIATCGGIHAAVLDAVARARAS